MENLMLNTSICVEKVVKILNENKTFNSVTKANICNYFYHYCLKILNLNTQDIKFKIKKIPILSYYNPAENEIGVSYEFVEKKGAFKIFDLIAHELRHCYQEKNKIKFKTFNTSLPITSELEKVSGDFLYIKFGENINNFSYYISSKNEQDANNFSNNTIIEFLEKIYKNKNATNKTKKTVKKLIKDVKRRISNQKIQLSKAKQNIIFSFDSLQTQAKNLICDELQYYLTHKKLNCKLSKLEQLLYIYCDDSITTNILQMGFKNNDIPLLTMCINHLGTKIGKENLTNYITLSIQNDIGLDGIYNNLSNWVTNDIYEAYKIASKEKANIKIKPIVLEK